MWCFGCGDVLVVLSDLRYTCTTIRYLYVQLVQQGCKAQAGVQAVGVGEHRCTALYNLLLSRPDGCLSCATW